MTVPLWVSFLMHKVMIRITVFTSKTVLKIRKTMCWHAWHRLDTHILASTIREKSCYYFSTKMYKLKNQILEYQN